VGAGSPHVGLSLDPTDNQTPALRGGGGWTFPITDLAKLRQYLQSEEGPDYLVAYTFSGELIKALEATGKRVITADTRDPLHDRPSYKGDVAEIIPLRQWEGVYCTGPPCYQTMRRDLCLANKLADGRAWWGVAEVAHCVCIPNARMIVVEQPDTIAEDYIQAAIFPSVRIFEVRTSQYGDAKDKFMRFTLVNAVLPDPPLSQAEARQAAASYRRPSIREYENANARDIDRSTWEGLTKMCESLAKMKPTSSAWPLALDYATVIEMTAGRWRMAGHDLPPSHDHASGRSPDAATRAYQTVRGQGNRPKLNASKPAVASSARRAEPGDQRLGSSPLMALFKLLDRKQQEEAPLSLEQERALRQAEGDVDGSPRETIFFWEDAGHMGFLSNFYEPCPFVDHGMAGGLQFNNVEQYLHYVKATHAGDVGTARTILGTTQPRRCRLLGRQVKGFSDKAWGDIARQVAERGVYLKFEQNPTLAERLQNTGSDELVEASPYDHRWGIGASAADAHSKTRAMWGLNWLGHALMRVRARLRVKATPPIPRALAHTHFPSGWGQIRAPPNQEPNDASYLAAPVGDVDYEAQLPMALKPLAAALAPRMIIVDRGGGGMCGQNSLAYGAACKGLTQLNGQELRAVVCAHGQALLDHDYVWSRRETPHLTLRTLLETSLRTWATGKRLATAEQWLELMEKPTTWADQAFLALAADYLGANVRYYAVDSQGTLLHTGLLRPSDERWTAALPDIAVALVLDQHYCAVVERQEADGTYDAPEGTPVLHDSDAVATGHSFDPALVPTESQLLLIMQESVDLQTEREQAACSAQEVEELGVALCQSQQELKPISALEQARAQYENTRREERRLMDKVIQASLEEYQSETGTPMPSQPKGLTVTTCEELERTLQKRAELQREYQLQLSLIMRRSLAEFEQAERQRRATKTQAEVDTIAARFKAAAQLAEADEDLVLDDEDGDLVLDDADEATKANHVDEVVLDDDVSTRPHTQEDDDLVLSDDEGPRDPPGRPASEEELEEYQFYDPHEEEYVFASSLYLGGGDTVRPPANEAPRCGEQPESIGGLAKQTGPSPAGLQVIHNSDHAHDNVVIVPYALHGGEPVVLLPHNSEGVYGLTRPTGCDKKRQPVVEQAEERVRMAFPDATAIGGFAAGADARGNRMVVVATEVEGRTVATSMPARNKLAIAGTLAWCAVGAFGTNTWQASIARLAVSAASHFISFDGATTMALKDELRLREATGLAAGKSDYHAPKRAALNTKGAITPRHLIGKAQNSLEDLKQQLRGMDDDYYRLWADAIQPLRISEVSDALLDQPLAIDDSQLDSTLFSAPLPVYETPWLSRAPAQIWETREGCEGYVANRALDLLDMDAQRALRAWFRGAKADAECLEALGPQCDRRSKPATIAIGQDQFHRCSRGYIWDCREQPCRLLDFEREISTHWDMEYLREKLEGYPDQRLASNILEGIRLEADLELMAVLNPQLASIGDGYVSVQKTVRELKDSDFYEFFDALPYMPIVVVGQGSRIKKLGAKQYRRTSNFSGPHKLVTDKQGTRVVPINEASKTYIVPKWISESRQQNVRRWAKEKYDHVPTPNMPGHAPSPRHKFPKEKKPSLADIMRDVAILLRASLHLGEPIFIWVEDAAFFFNQFGYASEELWKSNLIVNAQPGDLDRGGRAFKAGQLVFVSEKRLGFGSYASSNIA